MFTRLSPSKAQSAVCDSLGHCSDLKVFGAGSQPHRNKVHPIQGRGRIRSHPCHQGNFPLLGLANPLQDSRRANGPKVETQKVWGLLEAAPMVEVSEAPYVIV